MASDDWGGGTGGSWDAGGSAGGGGYSETTSQGWLARLGKALIAIPIGLLLVVGSFVLLFWNEGRAVRTARGLEEGKGAVVAGEAASVNPANERKLVHLSGEATTAETVTDPVLGVSAKALRLRRAVKMYQWEEHAETRTRKKLGGGEERVTTYDYRKAWSDRPINSSAFKQSAGHRNPSDWPFRTWNGQASDVTLGAFKLSPSLVGRIDRFEPLSVGEAERDAVPEALRSGLRLDDGRFYRGEDPAQPEVGDMTVAFEVVRPQVISLLAQQSGNSFVPFTTRTGTAIERVEPGQVAADEMFRHAETENATLTWVLRLVGFVLMAIGIAMALSILSVIADFVPIVGTIVGFGTGTLAIGLAFVLSLVTIAIAWMTYRPVIGIGVLALAALGLFGLLVRGRRRAAVMPQ